MRKIRKKGILATLFLALSILGCNERRAEEDVIMWYDKPATDWYDALPIGNGTLGAMVFGG